MKDDSEKLGERLSKSSYEKKSWRANVGEGAEEVGGGDGERMQTHKKDVLLERKIR